MFKTKQTDIEDGDDHPRPIVTYILLVIIWGLFIAMAALSHWHVSAFPDQVCDLFGYKQNSRILIDGRLAQWWRFVTPIFLHGGLLHVCVNTLSLYIIGKQIEPFYGSKRYFLIFMISGIAGVLASYRFSQNPSLGASGALFGLVGAGIVFPIRFRSLIPPAQGRRIVIQLAKVALFNLAIGFGFSRYVDNSAHIGGLLGGGFAALFLLPDALDSRTSRRASQVALWVCSGAMTLLIVSCGIAQARWAAGPWWSISVPGAFKPVFRVSQFQGAWKSYDGSSITIADTEHNPNLLPISVYFLERKDLPPQIVTVGGWHGRAFTFQNGADSGEIYLIVVYGRVFILTMRTSSAKFEDMRPQFDRIVRSVRFIHVPPPDLHVVPLAVRKPSSPHVPASTK